MSLESQREKKEGRLSIWKNNGWKYPILAKDINTPNQDTEKIPNRLNPKKWTPKTHGTLTWKLTTKKNILKTAREKWHVIHRGKTVRMTANFSSETIHATEWQNIF